MRSDGFDRISPRLVGWARQALFIRKFPTTGVIAVLLALHSCEVTRLYGFGPSFTSRCAKYFGDCLPLKGAYLESGASLGWHEFRIEYAWLAKLTRNFTQREVTCRW